MHIFANKLLYHIESHYSQIESIRCLIPNSFLKCVKINFVMISFFFSKSDQYWPDIWISFDGHFSWNAWKKNHNYFVLSYSHCKLVRNKNYQME